MRKLILLPIIFIFTTFNTYSQNSDYNLLFGMGLSYFNEETQQASQVGVNLSFAIFNVYMNVASNFASGEGEELDFSSSSSYSANKTSVTVINIGYIININKFGVIPIIGFTSSRKIYNDPILFDTYFYGESETSFNFGVKGMYFINDSFGISLGVGSYELVSAGVNLRI